MDKTKITIKYSLLLLSSAIAGAASGFFYLSSMGVRGAILGFSLGAAIILTNSVENKRLLSNLPPRLFPVIISAILSGLLAGFFINIYGMGGETGYHDFPPDPTSQGYSTITVSIFYSLFLHIAYLFRWKFKDGKFLVCLLMLSVAGCLGTLSRSYFNPSTSGEFPEQFFGMLMLSIFSGIPFALFWGLSVISFDPAWTFERIQQMKIKPIQQMH